MRSQMGGALAQTRTRSESHLRARDLRKGFGDGAVLDGVSLTVTAGQRRNAMRCRPSALMSGQGRARPAARRG